MDKIVINVDNLDAIVQRLELAKDLLNTTTTVPNKSGSGQALDVLKSINEEYDSMKEAVKTLFDHTKAYMINLGKSFEDQDQAMANSMKLEG